MSSVETAKPVTTENQSPTASATTSKRQVPCSRAIHGCTRPGEGFDQLGAYFCSVDLERSNREKSERAERIEAARRAEPLPLSEALEHLRNGSLLGAPILDREITLEPEPEDSRCQSCKGSGWVHKGLLEGETWATCLERCPTCADDLKAMRVNRLAVIAGLQPKQRSKTFSTFQRLAGTDSALKASAEWAKQPDGWLVVHGKPGCGKTHLALAAANALLDQERQVEWWYAPDLAARAKDYISENLHHAFLADLKRAEILFLDDLGAVKPTDFVLSELLEPLFDHRYQAGAPTFVTAIGDPEAIKAHFSPSIGRRMQDTTVARVVHNSAEQWEAGGG